jgi:broad specificity phosphatase PhoE
MKSCFPITRLGLLRHAQTAWNRKKRIQGQTDIPLTPEGMAQAGAWGRILKTYPWSRILASDSGRALKTAEAINASLQVPVSCDSRLREQDWGQWTGKTLNEIRQEAPQILSDLQESGWKFRPPGGESRHEMWERGHAALRDAVGRWPGEKILVVTHKGVIKCLIYRFYGRRFLPAEPLLIRPGNLHWLVHDSHGLRIEKINALPLP